MEGIAKTMLWRSQKACQNDALEHPKRVKRGGNGREGINRKTRILHGGYCENEESSTEKHVTIM